MGEGPEQEPDAGKDWPEARGLCSLRLRMHERYWEIAGRWMLVGVGASGLEPGSFRAQERLT